MSRPNAHAWRAALGATVVLLLLLVGGAATAQAAGSAKGPSQSFRVAVPAAPGSAATIPIDVDLYLPATSKPAPAVLLAHGFGGSKRSLASDAERLRGEGYVVLAYSARGFGRSGGQISLDSLGYEVADAKRLVDVLSSRPEVEKRDGDPVVGVYGESYGGALALMLGATDPRIDTVVASITWSDLAQALVPQPLVSASHRSASADSSAGVFKQAWATELFGAASSPFDGACGRFTPALCTLYTKLVGGGQLDPADRALLSASSPDSVLDGMTAPTLLLQGRQDTLFGLDQADANARQIAAAGAEVKVDWFAGGHDGGGTAGTKTLVDDWFAAHLHGATAKADAAEPFQFSVPASARSFSETRVTKSYPGLAGDARTPLSLHGHPDLVVNPPGGLPATISSLPGTGPLDSVIAGLGTGVAGTAIQPSQQAKFSSDPIADSFILVGSPSVTVDLAVPRFRRRGQPAPPPASAAPTPVLLYAQLRVVSSGSNVAVGDGVEPIRVALPSDGTMTRVHIQLPATTWRFERGDVVQLSLRTTDAGYQNAVATSTFVVFTPTGLSLPTVVSADPSAAGGSPSTVALVGIPIVLVIGLLLALIAVIGGRRRDRLAPADKPQSDAPPLVIRGLTKSYRNGFRAVDDLSFTVNRGQVLGLLGPNGAGKTTALRMITGLLRPDTGEVEIFGEPVVPGSRVLTRVGCFIEGPGFLPHLSGRRNLELFWAASGRPRSEARFAEALEIADLGTAVNRRVGGYSQGMRQRLAIAQAMLGMPELLILDEPTNGLDPPQIFALRGVLRRYAEGGRTVIVSSHLLGEVEQTCSDVVVMARGRLIANGTVADLAGETTELTVEVTDVVAASRAVVSLEGAEAVTVDAGTIRVVPGKHSPEAVVATIVAAGVGIRSVTRGRHLEETFLAMVGTEGII
jgi:ABC-2 type transport system ATP-binding protein